jgi:hypothetical protein
MKRKIIIFSLAAVLIAGAVAGILLRQSRDRAEKPVQAAKTEQKTQAAKPPEPAPAKPAPKAEAPRLRFGPKNGETLAFRFNTEADTEIDFSFLTPAGMPGNKTTQPPPGQGGEKTPVKMKASGELRLKYYDLEPGIWNVAAALSDVEYHLNDRKPIYAESLIYPFVFKMKSDGFLSDFQFTKGIPSEAEQFVKNILYTMQTAFPKEPKSEWKMRENDMTGQYRAEYALVSTDAAQNTAVIGKRKQEYLSTRTAQSGLNPSLSMSQTRIEKTQTDITIPLRGAWILTLEQQETVSSVAGGKEWSRSTGSFSVRRTEKDVSGTFPEKFDDLLAKLKYNPAVKAQYYATDDMFDEIGSKLDINGALEMYKQLKEKHPENAGRYAEKFFVNYLRQHPQACFDLVDIMDKDPKRERLDQSTQLILWRLITQAGHKEAQQAVIEAVTDRKFSDLTHIRALAYIHDFEHPESFVSDALWQFYKDLPAGSQEQTQQELKTMTLYALGSLGAEDKLNETIKPEISTRLVENLYNTKDTQEQATTLAALGNYGGEDVIDALEPYFSSEDERVRGAAFDALRRMEDPKASETLAKHFETESSPKVRVAALRTLKSMPPTSEGVAWANKTVAVTEEPEEQELLVTVIGENLKEHPENEKTLRELLKKNPDNRVKREIYKYIVP